MNALQKQPHAGDPWQLHMCMPEVEWPDPVGPVLRPDAARQAVGCLACASRSVSPWEVVSAVLPWLVFSILAAYSVARHYTP